MKCHSCLIEESGIFLLLLTEQCNEKNRGCDFNKCTPFLHIRTAIPLSLGISMPPCRLFAGAALRRALIHQTLCSSLQKADVLLPPCPCSRRRPDAHRSLCRLHCTPACTPRPTPPACAAPGFLRGLGRLLGGPAPSLWPSGPPCCARSADQARWRPLPSAGPSRVCLPGL